MGYVITGPGSVEFYYGTYHAGVANTEGSLSLTGPVSRSSPFTILTHTKPAGLVDGTNNFYSNSTALVGTNPNPGLNPVTWQGVAFSGLPDGDYTFTYIPIAVPTSEWAPFSDAIRSSTFSIRTGLSARSNLTRKTIEIVGGFMSRRNDLVAGFGPDTNRLVDRLQEAFARPGTGASSSDLSFGTPAEPARSETCVLVAGEDNRFSLDRLFGGLGERSLGRHTTMGRLAARLRAQERKLPFFRERTQPA